MKFRYIAPGIRIQNPAEFASQPFTEPRENFKPLSKIEESTYGLPTLLFRADGANSSPWTRPWFPDGIAQDVPAGLYIEPTCRSLAQNFGNESRLQLPFGVSSNGYARSSNGIPLSHCPSTEGLYQVCHFSGFLPTSLRCVQVHKVLLNWAERVELADWEVNEDGVAGGIEKLKEADTRALAEVSGSAVLVEKEIEVEKCPAFPLLAYNITLNGFGFTLR